jgi:hypothetical protein
MRNARDITGGPDSGDGALPELTRVPLDLACMLLHMLNEQIVYNKRCRL